MVHTAYAVVASLLVLARAVGPPGFVPWEATMGAVALGGAIAGAARGREVSPLPIAAIAVLALFSIGDLLRIGTPGSEVGWYLVGYLVAALGGLAIAAPQTRSITLRGLYADVAIAVLAVSIVVAEVVARTEALPYWGLYVFAAVVLAPILGTVVVTTSVRLPALMLLAAVVASGFGNMLAISGWDLIPPGLARASAMAARLLVGGAVLAWQASPRGVGQRAAVRRADASGTAAPCVQDPSVTIRAAALMSAIVLIALFAGLFPDPMSGGIPHWLVAIAPPTLIAVLLARLLRLLWALVVAHREAALRALQDDLTGLVNRTGVLRALDGLLAHGGVATVVVIDIDRFHAINEGFGHAIGDQVLVAVGRRLRQAVRGHDVVGRLAADQFVAVLSDPGVAEAVITGLQASFGRPLEGGAAIRRLRPSASIGIAHAVGGSTGTQLLRDADLALREARARGTGQVQHFLPDQSVAADDRNALLADLQSMLLRGGIDVVYQPIVGAADGRIEAVEALARWAHPVRGAVSPATFVPLAEQGGLIVDLGRQVLDRACADLRTIQDALDLDDLNLHVNISPRQILDPALHNDIAAALAASGIRSGRLVLEITEGLPLEDLDRAAVELSAIERTGTRIALDDFGKGYASLDYLRHLPLSTIKVDRAFTEDVERAGDRLGRAVMRFVSGLGLPVVAEGVTTIRQAEAMAALGCGLLQGFAFSTPLPLPELLALLRRGRHLTAADVPERARQPDPHVAQSIALPMALDPARAYPVVPLVGVPAPTWQIEGAPILRDVAIPAVVVAPSTPVLALEGHFRNRPGLSCIVVGGEDPTVLTRAFHDAELAGPYGYGRALYSRRTVATMPLLPTRVLDPQLPIVDAVEMALGRPYHQRYDDLLIERDGSFATASVARLLEAMAASYGQQARTDSLTGLPNRLAFIGALHRAAADNRHPSALMFIDLDGFKSVNDSHGHSVGDALLTITAQRLTRVVGDRGLVARLSGDEFAVLLSTTSAPDDEIQRLAQAIADAVAEPVQLSNTDVVVTASIGVAIGLLDAEQPIAILSHADVLMYEAKRTGPERMCIGAFPGP